MAVDDGGPVVCRLLAPAPSDGPHVLAARQLEGGDDLRPNRLLQDAQRPVLPVSGRGHQLHVRVGLRPLGQLLRQEGRLAHRHLPAGADVQEAVADLEGVGGDPGRADGGGAGSVAAVNLQVVLVNVADVRGHPVRQTWT